MTTTINAHPNTDERDRVLDAVVSASRALADTTPRDRAGLLRRIAEHIEAATSALVPTAVAETGLGADRLAGEVARTANQFRLAADVVEEGSWLGVSIDHMKAPFDDHCRMNISLGPVLVFAASNFPFAFGVLGTDTASALAAGCAVVAKGHPGHPRLASQLGSVMGTALQAAGAPAELFSLVEGDAAIEVLQDERITAGAFTGSIQGGAALLTIAQNRPRPIPFFAEMGSINPVIVTERAWTARRDEILAGLVASMTQSNGQLCTSPGLVLIPKTLDLADATDELMSDTQPAPLLTDSIAHSFRAGIDDLADDQHVTALSPVVVSAARAATPVLWSVNAADMDERSLVLKELFGPSSVLVQYESPESILSVVDYLDGQLTASIFSEPEDDITPLVSALAPRVGRLLNNAWPTGVAVSWSMHHGGPWPASSSSSAGSVGAEGILRFLRPVAYQNFAEQALPPALKEDNPWKLPRRVNGVRESV